MHQLVSITTCMNKKTSDGNQICRACIKNEREMTCLAQCHSKSIKA